METDGIPNGTSCWTVEEEVGSVLGHSRASRAGSRVDDGLTVEVCPSVEPVEVEEPTEDPHTARDARVPNVSKSRVGQLRSQRLVGALGGEGGAIKQGPGVGGP